MTAGGIKISVSALNNLIADALCQEGISKKDAEVFAHHIVMAELCGVSTHGLSMVPAHLKRLNSGGYNKTPKIIVEKATAAFSRVNSDNAIGMVSADYCMKRAISQAQQQGLHVVFAKNCNTFSAAFTYTKSATDVGMIGCVFSNTPPAMAAWNGDQKLIGTNPIAIGIPGKKEGPILFDIATSTVAKSKINEAKKREEKIPIGWALDENGAPTTDPIKAIKGLLIPMAGVKGFGLALCIDILSGVISGSGYADQVNKFYSSDLACMNVGQTFIAIDPQMVCGDEFYENVDEYIQKIHMNSKSGTKEVCFPGEHKLQKMEAGLKEGLEVSKDVFELLTGFAKE